MGQLLESRQPTMCLWRHERLPLPVCYLDDVELLGKLHEALSLAESVGALLGAGYIWLNKTKRPRPLQVLASEILFPLGGREPHQKAVQAKVNSIGAKQLYWSGLEIPFKELIILLPKDKDTAEDGTESYGSKVLPQWAQRLRRTAWQAFSNATCDLDTTGLTLRAAAMARQCFAKELNRILGQYNQERR